MKKLIIVFAAVSAVVAASATTYDNVYISGLKGSYVAPQGGPTDLVGAGVLAFDPTSTAGGEYNRIYLADTTQWAGHGRIHSFNPLTGAYSGALTSADILYSRDLDVDSSGNVYVAAPWNSSGTVLKITDPTGAATMSSVLARPSNDDTTGLVMVPAGFGGGFDSGVDMLVADTSWNGSGNDAVAVVDSASTGATPLTSTLLEYSSTEQGFIAGSDVEGLLYLSHKGTVDEDLLGGVNKRYVIRMDSAGNTERVFLDIDPTVLGTLDDGLEINQANGSLWMLTKGTTFDLYRIDVANAADQGGGDYLASIDHVIADIGFDPGINGMALSPDGKQLALVGPGGADTMYMYDIIPEPATIGLFGFLGVAMLWIRRKFAI